MTNLHPDKEWTMDASVPAAAPVGLCPSWCERGSGHPWDEYTQEGPVRTHARTFGAVDVIAHEFGGVDGAMLEAPLICGYLDSSDLMTPAEARQYAAELVQAAAYLETL